MLVCPRREVKRFVDLTADETSDLWLTAQEVGSQLESYHKASSLTFAIQVRKLYNHMSVASLLVVGFFLHKFSGSACKILPKIQGNFRSICP